MNYTYILRLSDGSFYTGWTNNLNKRVQSHNNGTASKCTRSKRPVELIYYEIFDTKSEAMKREYEIKLLTRKQKENLVYSHK